MDRLWGSMADVNFQRLFDALSSPHMVLDREWRFVAANAAYERVTMRRREELMGRGLFELFPNEGEGGRRLKASFSRVFETGETDTVAFIPYDIPRPEAQGGGMEKRYWTATHIPIRDAGGAIAFLMQNTVDVTDIVRLREAANLPFRSGETQLLERAREAEEQHRALMAESADFRRLFQQAPGFFAVLSGPDHVFTFANDAYARLVGERALVGKPVREALPEIEGQGFLEMLDAVYASGEPAGGEAMRVMLRRTPGQPLQESFLDFSYDAIRDAHGRITGVFVQGMDRTETVRTQRRQRLLLDELNHRVKNTLASVQSIASQTLRSAPDLATARRSFEARIMALSNAHNLLSREEWSSAELRTLLDNGLAAYDESRLELDGPAVMLTPKASIAVALVVHELATNAAKYGALSNDTGTVGLRWRVAAAGEGLSVEWRERGGPPVSPPTRRGFGSRIIEGFIAGELGGTCDVDYAPEGFSCRLALPGDAVLGVWR